MEGHLAGIGIHAGGVRVGALVGDLGARRILAHVALAGDGESSVAQGLGHRVVFCTPVILAGVIRRQLDGLRGFGDGDLVGSDLSRIVLGFDDRGNQILAHVSELDAVGVVRRTGGPAAFPFGSLFPGLAGVGQRIRSFGIRADQAAHRDAVDGLGRAGVGVGEICGVGDSQGRLGDLKRIPGGSRDVVVAGLLALGEGKVDFHLVAAGIRRNVV